MTSVPNLRSVPADAGARALRGASLVRRLLVALATVLVVACGGAAGSAPSAAPQLGNTQDVALRHWLRTKGLETTPEGGGDVAIHPQDNSQTLQTFRAGQIDGAWVPEPWATRLVSQGGGKVLVDERDLWKNG